MTQPPPSNSGYPLRALSCPPSQLIGFGSNEVLQKLGPPDAREKGRHWSTSEGPPPGTMERAPSGDLRKVAVFGPVPRRIPPGAPYQTWVYRNVQGETWLLYFTHPDNDRRMQLEEVLHYPAGAVF